LRGETKGHGGGGGGKKKRSGPLEKNMSRKMGVVQLTVADKGGGGDKNPRNMLGKCLKRKLRQKRIRSWNQTRGNWETLRRKKSPQNQKGGGKKLVLAKGDHKTRRKRSPGKKKFLNNLGEQKNYP